MRRHRVHVRFEDESRSLEVVLAETATVADLADALDVDPESVRVQGAKNGIARDVPVDGISLLDGSTIVLTLGDGDTGRTAAEPGSIWLDHLSGLPAMASQRLQIGRTSCLSPRSQEREVFAVELGVDESIEVVRNHDAVRIGEQMVEERARLGDSVVSVGGDRYSVHTIGAERTLSALSAPHPPSLELEPPPRTWSPWVLGLLGVALVLGGVAWNGILFAGATVTLVAAVLTAIDAHDGKRMRLRRQAVERRRRLDRYRAELVVAAERDARIRRAGQISVPGMIRSAAGGAQPRRRQRVGRPGPLPMFVGYGDVVWEPPVVAEHRPSAAVADVIEDVARMYGVPIDIEHPGVVRVGGPAELARQWVSAVILSILWDDPDAQLVPVFDGDTLAAWDWMKWLVADSAPSRHRSRTRIAVVDEAAGSSIDDAHRRGVLWFVIDPSSDGWRAQPGEHETIVAIDAVGHADIRVRDRPPQRISPIGIRLDDADTVARAIARARGVPGTAETVASAPGVRPFRLVDVLVP